MLARAVPFVMSRVLVIDSDQAVLAHLRSSMETEGHQLITASDGATGLSAVVDHNPDLIILELALPDHDGFEMCRRLRERTQAPILVLTARDDEADRVVALEIGADDYMIKPVGTKELMARVRAHLRRSGKIQPVEQVLSAGALVVDLGRHEARLDQRRLELKPREFDLLVFLMRNQGRIITRDHLVREIWGYEAIGHSRTVDVHVSRLREKIEDDPHRPVRIVTVRGVGYRFLG